MSDKNIDQVKLMYELAKISDNSKKVSDDFYEAACMTMFYDFILRKEDPLKFITDFLDSWKETLMDAKKAELDNLISHGGSMKDMATGAALADMDNLEDFEQVIDDMQNIYLSAMMEFMSGDDN